MKRLGLESRPAAADQEIKIVDMDGELGPSTTAEFESFLGLIISQSEPKVVLNMKKINYISGVGFGALLAAQRDIRRQSGELKLVQLSADIFELFKILNFHEMFQILRTEEEAVKGFKPTGGTNHPAENKG